MNTYLAICELGLGLGLRPDLGLRLGLGPGPGLQVGIDLGHEVRLGIGLGIGSGLRLEPPTKCKRSTISTL